MRALPTCSHYTLFRFEIDQITAYLDILTEHLLKTNDVSGKRIYLKNADFKLSWPTLLLLHIGKGKGKRRTLLYMSTPSQVIVFLDQNQKEMRIDSSINTRYVSLSAAHIFFYQSYFQNMLLP